MPDIPDTPLPEQWLSWLRDCADAADRFTKDTFELFSDRVAEVFVVELTDHSPWMVP